MWLRPSIRELWSSFRDTEIRIQDNPFFPESMVDIRHITTAKDPLLFFAS